MWRWPRKTKKTKIGRVSGDIHQPLPTNSQLDHRLVESIKADAKSPTEVLRLFHKFHRKTDALQQRQRLKRKLLCLAVEHGRTELVEYLLQRGYSVNVQPGDDGRYHPLHVAILFDRENLLVPLMKRGTAVDVECRCYSEPSNSEESVKTDEFLYSSLELSIVLDRPNLMFILDKSYDRKKTPRQRTALHYACLHGARRCLEQLLADPRVLGEDLNLFDDDEPHRCTPLMLGVRHGSWLTRMLLDVGASATLTSKSIDGYSALHFATSRASYVDRVLPEDLPQVLQLLLKAGCDVNAAVDDGMTMETAISLLCAHVRQEFEESKPQSNVVDFETHRRNILTSSVDVLLTSGAELHSSDDRRPPLEVLTEMAFHASSFLKKLDAKSDDFQTGFARTLRTLRLTSSFIESLYASTSISGEKYSHCSPAARVLDAVDCCRSIQLFPKESTTDSLADVIGILADVFRLLLLAGAEVKCSGYDLYLRLVSDIVLYSPFNEMQANVGQLYTTRDRHVASELEYLSPDRKCELIDLLDDVTGQPRTLKNLSRQVIVRGVIASSQGLKSYSQLGLPRCLLEYIVSLRDWLA